MIVYRRAEKRCNVCKDLLAVKRFLFFKTVHPYIPVSMEIDGIVENYQIEMHICQECWMKLKENIQKEIAEDGKND